MKEELSKTFPDVNSWLVAILKQMGFFGIGTAEFTFWNFFGKYFFNDHIYQLLFVSPAVKLNQ